MELSPIAREEGIWLFEGQLLFHQLLLNPVFENPLHMNTLLQKELHCNKTSEESSWTELTEVYARKGISPKAHKEWHPGKMAESDSEMIWNPVYWGGDSPTIFNRLLGIPRCEANHTGEGGFLKDSISHGKWDAIFPQAHAIRAQFNRGEHWSLPTYLGR